ncbi:MAG TPA: hypothetical protein VK502_01290 [Candidatus Saccharimonadales bacterium]|nr:hypothetical protein [Candidatus Saccharimonadales bacterium]
MILLKQHTSPQVAHLYEHLFGMALDDFFYEEELFNYVDYVFHAYTLLPGGIVCVDISLYTDKAKLLANKISMLTVALDDRSINTAIAQLIAEEERQLGMTSIENIRKELSEIEAQSWRDIDDVDEIDPKHLDLMHGALYTPQNAEKVAAQKFGIAFILDQTFTEGNRELLPLFWQLATVIHESVAAALYREVGCYSKNVTRTYTRETTKLTRFFHINPGLPVEASNALAIVGDVLLDLHATGTFKRFITELATTSFNDPHRPAPDPALMFNPGAVLIGAKGWRRIATDANCKLVLSRMKVMVSAGRKRSSLKVGSVLNK